MQTHHVVQDEFVDINIVHRHKMDNNSILWLLFAPCNALVHVCDKDITIDSQSYSQLDAQSCNK